MFDHMEVCLVINLTIGGLLHGHQKLLLGMYVCVCSNSRNDVLRVAQRYGTIVAHTRRLASVLVVFAVFLRAHAQFCRFDKADATADVQ